LLDDARLAYFERLAFCCGRPGSSAEPSKGSSYCWQMLISGASGNGKEPANCLIYNI
jgi:hypothetical protein